MPYEVEVPEIGVVEFPDELSEDDIANEIRKLTGESQPPGLPDILSQPQFEIPFQPGMQTPGAFPPSSPTPLIPPAPIQEPQPASMSREFIRGLNPFAKAEPSEATEAAMIGREATAGMPPESRAAKANELSRQYDARIRSFREQTMSPNQAVAERARFAIDQLQSERDAALQSIGVTSAKTFGGPSLPKATTQDVTTLTGIEGRPAAAIASGQRALTGLAEMFASPEGMGLALPKAGTVIAKSFLAMMAKDAATMASEAAGRYSAGDVEGGDEALINATMIGVMLGIPAAKARGKNAAVELSRLLNKTELEPSRLTPDQIASLRLSLPPRVQVEMLPELARTRDLIDQALQEATQKVKVPGQQSAIEQIKAQTAEIEPVTIARAERIPGGGEAPYGKTSFMRPAEAPSRAVIARQESPPAVKESLTSKPSEKVLAEPPPPPKAVVVPGDVKAEARFSRIPESELADAVRTITKHPGGISSGPQWPRWLLEAMTGLERSDVNNIGLEAWLNTRLDQIKSQGETYLDYSYNNRGALLDLLTAQAKKRGLELQISDFKDQKSWKISEVETPESKPTPPVREMRPIEPGRGEEITAPSVETVRAQRELEARQKGAEQAPAEVSPKAAEALSPEQSLEFDKQLFSDLGAVRSQMIKEGKFDTPEFKKLWQDLENIKNRHGGMPPGQTSPARTVPPSPEPSKGVETKLEPATESRGLASLSPAEAIDYVQKTQGPDISPMAALKWHYGRIQQAFRDKVKINAKAAESYEPDITGSTQKVSDWLMERGYSKEGDMYVYREKGSAPAVEQVTPLDPQSGSPLSATDALINKLEALKFPERGGATFSVPHPDAIKAIGRNAWNGAVNIAIDALKAGKAIAEAVDAAIGYLRKNVKGFDEAKARANIEFVAKAETKAPAPAASKATVPPITKGVTLDDVYKRFEPSPKAKPGFSGTKIVEAVRTGLASKFRPIDKLSEDIGKAYGVTTPKGVAGIFEQLKGSTGKAEADIYRFDRDVSRLVKGSEKDFNAYMFLRRSLDRLRQDLADIQKAQAGGEVKTLNRRQVAGYTIPELESKLALLESNIGPEKVKQFETTSDLYQQHMDAALRLQVESGRMSPEVYNAIKQGNEFYAPFKVMKYFEEVARPEGTGRKIDTVADFTKAMEGIEDPNFKLGDMLGAARQNIMLSRILAEKNNTMRRLSQLAEFDVDSLFIKKLKLGQEPAKNMMAVNVKEAGKTERYEVNKDVADAVQTYSGVSDNIIVQMMGWFAVPMKAGATAWNIPFQVSNVMADIPRQALVSKFGVKNPVDLVRYPSDLIAAVHASISGDVFKHDNKLFLDFLDSGAAGTTFQEHLTPEALRFKPSTLERTSKDFAKSVLYKLPDFAKAVEQTSKIVGVRRAMRETGAKTGAQLAKEFPEAITEIRRFSGSPDFGRQGKWVEQARLNLLYMFFNARLQGTIADLGRLGGRDGAGTAAKTWFKLAAAIGIPTYYLYALNNSPELREEYQKRPLQERQNYWLIPKDTFITNEQGEKMRDYWRIPKRESSKWIANMLESSLEFAEKKSPDQFGRWVEAAVEDISPLNISGETLQERLESTAASLNPVLKAPIEMATGRDLYRHRETVPQSMQKASPELQYTERTPEVFRKMAELMPDVAPEVFRSPLMLENLTRNLTAGLFTQFLPRRPVEGRKGIENTALMQRFQAVPYTDSAEFDQRMKLLEREAADTQLTRFRDANAIMDANKGKSLKIIVTAAKEKHGLDVRLIQRLVDLYVAEQRGITTQERRILSLPVQQRAAFLVDEFKGLDKQQKEQLIRNYANKRILTEDVAAELVRIWKEK